MNKQEPTLDEKLDAIREQKIYLLVQVILSVCFVGIWYYFSIELIIDNEEAFYIRLLMTVLGILPLGCFLLVYNDFSSTQIAEQRLKKLIKNKDKGSQNEHS